MYTVKDAPNGEPFATVPEHGHHGNVYVKDADGRLHILKGGESGNFLDVHFEEVGRAVEFVPSPDQEVQMVFLPTYPAV